jgi:hypothetical protein
VGLPVPTLPTRMAAAAFRRAALNAPAASLDAACQAELGAPLSPDTSRPAKEAWRLVATTFDPKCVSGLGVLFWGRYASRTMNTLPFKHAEPNRLEWLSLR